MAKGGDDLEGPSGARNGGEADAECLLDVIRKDAGVQVSRARRRSGLGRRQFERALEGLVGAGRIHRVRSGRAVLLFPDRPGVRDCLVEIKVLACAQNRRLHLWLTGFEFVPFREVVSHARSQWEWREHVTRWRMRLLEDVGLLCMRPDLSDARSVHCLARPAHPVCREFFGLDRDGSQNPDRE